MSIRIGGLSRAQQILLFVALCLVGTVALAACRDTAVLVHGNTASPSSWDRTYNKLRNNGWSSYHIIRPNWGSKTCAACNNHSGAELDTVKSAIRKALNRTCTGRIAVIGHSMGVTLAALAIKQMGVHRRVNNFVGIAGAMRGLNSCGTYPYHVRSSTCGKWGLSKNSYTMRAIKGHRFGRRMYSIKSYYDQIVCMGGCFVSGTHTSNIWNQNRTYTYNNLGHFGLQKYTTWRQESLID